MADYVYGLSKSGLSIVKLLKKQKKIFYCWDDDDATRKLLNKKFSNLNFAKINKTSVKKCKNLWYRS